MLNLIKKVIRFFSNRLKLSSFISNTNLPNDLPPAIVFKPYYAPENSKIQKNSFSYSSSTVSLPDIIDRVAFYSLPQLASLLKSRRLSSIDLTHIYLERLKKFNPILNCVVNITEDRAIQQANNADEEIKSGIYRGILHGIPWGVKDFLSVEGYPTTWGIEAYKNRTIDLNATVVDRLDKSGAVLIAKLSSGAFGNNDLWFKGQTMNPWDPTKGSGGSSCGPGSATAAGLVGFSIGTETLYSITVPCMKCGVTGLRPTYGSVSRHGTMALSWSMDKIGPICRNVEDCAIVFDAIRGPDENDRDVISYPFLWDSSYDIKNLKVGYVEDEFNYEGEINTGELKIVVDSKKNQLSLETLRNMGVDLIPVTLPHFDRDLAENILQSEGAAAFDYKNIGMQDLINKSGRKIKKFRASRFVSAVQYIQMNRIRTLLMQQMECLFSKIDVLVSPTYVGPVTCLTNLTGHPSTIIPNGTNNKGDLVSLSFFGRLCGETELLSMAHAYQLETKHHLNYPPGFFSEH